MPGRITPEIAALKGRRHGPYRVTADCGDGGLHASQAYEFERPLRAGDVIDVSFTVTDVYEKSGRSGDLVFIEREYEFRDAKTGARAGGGKWIPLRRFTP